jgi:GLPGLI family protein
MKAGLLTSVITIFLYQAVVGQDTTMKALYHVQSSYNVAIKENVNKSVLLDYEGVFLKKGNTFLTYLKPLYTQKYPEGYVDIDIQDEAPLRVPVPMDSLNRVKYVSMDSFVIRNHHGSTFPNASGSNTVFTFEAGCRSWLFSPEEKWINGFACQKAVMKSSSSPVEVWFTTDIPVACGPFGLLDLPGLAVEVWFPTINEKWTLKEVVSGIEINDEQLWPVVFNAPFRFVNHLKRKQL